MSNLLHIFFFLFSFQCLKCSETNVTKALSGAFVPPRKVAAAELAVDHQQNGQTKPIMGTMLKRTSVRIHELYDSWMDKVNHNVLTVVSLAQQTVTNVAKNTEMALNEIGGSRDKIFSNLYKAKLFMNERKLRNAVKKNRHKPISSNEKLGAFIEFLHDE
ncbi:hypothetical protein SNEBB_006046 [Seison nebaliae]|nr:hypothetical protein SNEBB_006046 [Seison nebaliae]